MERSYDSLVEEAMAKMYPKTPSESYSENPQVRALASNRKNCSLLINIIGDLRQEMLADATLSGYNGAAMGLIEEKLGASDEAIMELEELMHTIGGKIRSLQAGISPYSSDIKSVNDIKPVQNTTTQTDIESFKNSVVKSKVAFMQVVALDQELNMTVLSDESYESLKQVVLRYRDLTVFEKISFLREFLKALTSANKVFEGGRARTSLGMLYQGLKYLSDKNFMNPIGEFIRLPITQ